MAFQPLSYFQDGTVNVKLGDDKVIGVGTFWITTTEPNPPEAGQLFTVDRTNYYLIVSVDSDTELTIKTPYSQPTRYGVNYAITTGDDIKVDVGNARVIKGVIDEAKKEAKKAKDQATKACKCADAAKNSESAAKTANTAAQGAKKLAEDAKTRTGQTEQRINAKEKEAKAHEQAALKHSQASAAEAAKAKASQTASAGSAKAAKAEKDAAANERTQAIAAKVAAEKARDLSKKWADSPTAVEGGKFSAKHWADVANQNANRSFISGGVWNPDATPGKELPDTATIQTDTIWIISLNKGMTSHRVTAAGALNGVELRNGDMLVWDVKKKAWALIATSTPAVLSVNNKATQHVTITWADIGGDNYWKIDKADKTRLLSAKPKVKTNSLEGDHITANNGGLIVDFGRI
ncbi:hypothetical protein [Photobacterium damselae]|uniref:hypothetical protein n=1 Tax=Photobacterium damselae TaxID=38293 RepID=UPI001F292456|nr:hypothetical protein [Photobacterium damselae]UKA12932.1 hypothetical protein IHC91_21340 [Photobacterium damselae subsp. damselae]